MSVTKRKSYGDGTIRQRPDGRWEGRFYVDGERKSVFGKTEKEVKKSLKTITHQIANNEYFQSTTTKFADYVTNWYELYGALGLRDGTIGNYESYIFGHFIPDFGKQKLVDLSTGYLQSFFNRKATKGRLDGKPGGLSTKSLKNMRNMLKHVFDQALSEKLVLSNPVSGVKLPSIVKTPMPVLSAYEQLRLEEAVVAASYENVMALGIILDLYTGLRIGELLALTVDKYDISVNTICVSSTINRLKKPKNTRGKTIIDTGAPSTNKTALILGPVKTLQSNRVLPLPEKAAKALRALLKHYEDSKARNGSGYNPHNFLLFNQKGHPFDQRTYADLFKRLLNEANISDINFHSLRHTFATRALESGFGTKTLSELLGHTMASTTLNMYVHSLEEQKRTLMGSFDVGGGEKVVSKNVETDVYRLMENDEAW